jgi:hypothetical protein
MRNSMPAGNIRPPGPGQIIYSGPSRLPATISPPTTVVELQKTSVPGINSTTSYGVVVSAGDVYNLSEYTDYWSNLYQEYRVLSVRLEFHPNFENSNSFYSSTAPIFAGAQGTWYTMVNRLPETPTSYADFLNNSSLRITAFNRPFTRTAKMQNSAEADFVLSSNPPSVQMAISAFIGTFGSNEVLINFGVMFARYIVELRTRV